ncbi:MAG: hypothetical protein V7L01_28950 [Nostoc sp.]|uniref:hypothetical protein n=1 Tax=Nostoc sp. TaxID=1180 RepID=UPI002FF790DD
MPKIVQTVTAPIDKSKAIAFMFSIGLACRGTYFAHYYLQVNYARCKISVLGMMFNLCQRGC